MEPKKYFRKIGGGFLEVWPTEDGDPILFYPGTMLAPGHYAVMLRALAEAGFTVASPHFAGHGLARRNRLDTFRSMLDECLEAAAYLRDLYGKVAVAGHSQGGILALAQAGESPDLSASFSICAAFPHREEAIDLTRFAPLRARRERLLGTIVKLAARFPSLPIPLPFYLPLGKLLEGKREPVAMGRDEGRISYPLKFLASLFSAKLSEDLLCPYYLLSAINDGLFTRKLTETVFDAIKAPIKELIWLPDGGHLAPLNPALASFMARYMASVCSGLGFSLNLREAAREAAR
ncbi:MAG: alpha/beta hydrolase [Desulfovibrio sp.]|nr:alpha/beta hydrolase [Desulfovibrio sp.]